MTTLKTPPTIEAATVPAELTIRAEAPVDIQAAEAEGSRPRFSIVGYTGAPVRVGGFYHPVIVDLRGLKAASQQIPALRGHDPDRIVGQTDSIEIGADVRLAGVITGDNADAGEVVSQSRNGFRWQASIGAGVVRHELLEPGRSATVNGRTVRGPLVIARESVLKEISFVALGADHQTSAEVAAHAPPPAPAPVTRQGKVPMQFEQWLQARGIDPAALDDAVRTALRASFDAEHSATPPAGPPPQPPARDGRTGSLDEVLAAARQEEDRQAAIARITAQAIQDRPMMLDEIEQMGRAAVAARSTPAEYELAILRATRAGAPAVARGRDARATARVIEAALCLSGGLGDVERHFDAPTLEAADARFRHGMGLCDLLIMAARENGYAGTSARDVGALLEAAFARGRGDLQASGFSTMSLPGIMSNVANKFLAAGFTAVESGWRQIAARRPVSDFKAVTSYSLTGGMEYEKVGPSGELKHATLGESSYSNRAETYGRILSITRKDIINDDLGALTQVPMKLGRGAALKLNDVFWTTFLAGVGSFWAAGNNNLVTGASSALASAGLKAAQEKFRKQTDPDGKPLGLLPRLLLVPVELETTADELLLSLVVNPGGASTSEKVPNRNVWASKFVPVASTYLSNPSYTGQSSSAWYLLAHPDDLATIEVAFLNGRETPVVESADADFHTLGIQMRGYHDFGVALQEFRGSVRAAGA